MTKLANRVISIFDRKTSMRLAIPEWTAVEDICRREHIKRKKLFEIIYVKKDPKLGFTCSVRLFTITYMHNLLQNYTPDRRRIKHANDYTNIENIMELMS